MLILLKFCLYLCEMRDGTIDKNYANLGRERE